MLDYLCDFIFVYFNVEDQDVVLIFGILGLLQVNEFIFDDNLDQFFLVYELCYFECVMDYGGDCFVVIKEKDIVVYYFYESFNVVVEFLCQVVVDLDVVVIKQMLYCMLKNLFIVVVFVEVVEFGKNVMVLVEFKVWFDEEVNLKWVCDFECVGVQVVYGFIEYKIYVKILLVVWCEGNDFCIYFYFGIGNYYLIIVKVYMDFFVFIVDLVYGCDVGWVFNYVMGYVLFVNLECLLVLLINFKDNLIEMIDNEIVNVQVGKFVVVWVKLNVLVYFEIIDVLYCVSQVGVKVELVVCGICCLWLGIFGLFDNICVKSIVGCFFEYMWFVCFVNGELMLLFKVKVFILFVDWMLCNLDWCVEYFCFVQNLMVYCQIFDQIMVVNFNDEVNSWYMDGDGDYCCVDISVIDDFFSVYVYFMINFSFFGCGEVFKDDQLLVFIGYGKDN